MALTGIFNIDTATYEEMLEFNIKSRGNLLVFGQAGIGKTEIPFQVAKRMGFETVYWNLSTQEAPDLVGMPLIKMQDGYETVQYAAPSYMPVTERTLKPVVVIVDELDKAKADLQNPLLEVFQSHTINGRALNIQAIVATGNLPEEGAFSKPVSHALTNRCKVFRLNSSFDAWQEHMAATGGNPLVVGFLSRNNEYLSRPPVEGDPTAYTRCSPRAWTKAGQDLDSSGNASVDFQTLIVAGRVGQEPAAKFRVWLDHYRHIEPMIDALVNSGKMPNVESMPIDRVLVTAISASGQVAKLGRAEKAKTETVKKACENVFNFLKELPPDFQVAAVKSTMDMEVIKKHNLTSVPSFMKTYINIRSAMKGE